MQVSMALLIAPVDVAAQITDILAGVSSEDDSRGHLVRAALDRTVQYNGEEVPIRSFMVGGEITDGSDQWGVHSGDYSVRAGQYGCRFFFLALSSVKGDRREGNLLDKVWFSTEPAPPVAGHANLTLRKTQAGRLPAAELTALRAEARQPADGETVETDPCFDLTAVPAGDFVLTIANGLTLTYTETDRTCTLRFTDAAIAAGRTERKAVLDAPCRSLRGVGDASSLEIFLIDGAAVLSTRYYPAAGKVAVQLCGAGSTLYSLSILRRTFHGT